MAASWWGSESAYTASSIIVVEESIGLVEVQRTLFTKLRTILGWGQGNKKSAWGNDKIRRSKEVLQEHEEQKNVNYH